MRPHLYGTSPYIPDAQFLTADELFRQSGGNTGNLLFCHAISRMLNVGTASIAWGADISGLRSEHDCLVMPLANQLGAHVDLANLAEKMRDVHVPMVGIGLGAQGPIGGIDGDSIPEGSWEWLRALTSKAASDRPNVALRGQTTFDLVASKGLDDRCIVIGCPSNFINPSATLGREIYRRRANGLRRIAVAAGNPFLPQFKKLEQSLVKLMEEGDGMYVCQHPVDMLRLQRGEYGQISRKNYMTYRDYICPELDDDSFLLWFRRYAHAFTSVPEWLSVLNGFDVVIGTRIHGVMAAIQAGLPGICLCIDSRTLELCRTMLIPHVDANDYRNGVSRAEIFEILRQWEWRDYDANRVALANRLVKFFKDNKLEAVGAPLQIVNGQTSFSARYSEKPKNNEVHQVSTASIDGRYPSIFTALANQIDQVAPKILSFGCSDGFETNDLASKHFHHSPIIGCDIDDDAIRIATKQNRFPSRVKFIKSSREELESHAPFDAIVSMAVLCRWPDTQKLENIKDCYGFDKFVESIELLVSLLRPGGVLCIYNANYLVSDTPCMEKLEAIEDANLIPRSQQVKLFKPSGEPYEEQQVRGVLFRKRADIDG